MRTIDSTLHTTLHTTTAVVDLLDNVKFIDVVNATVTVHNRRNAVHQLLVVFLHG